MTNVKKVSKKSLKKSAKKSNSKKTSSKARKSKVAHKKAVRKTALKKATKQSTKSHTVRILNGSALEKVHDVWSRLTAHKRKLILEVGDSLLDNSAQLRPIRASLKPKEQKPKRPMTGYLLFVHENYSRVSEANPEMKSTQIANLLGQEWKTLSEEVQTEFKMRKVVNTKVPVSNRLDPAEKARRAAERAQLRMATA